VAVLAALLSAGVAGAAKPAGTKVSGTVTLNAFDVTKSCTSGLAADKRAAIVKCTDAGAFAGSPGPAGAGYGWAWSLAVDAAGGTTGYGTERGNLILNFGPRGLLYLTLLGRQKPSGAPTATRAKGVTTGTWNMTRGTAGLKGLHGSGTYTFTIARAGSKTTYSSASLTLAGSIS
jgi:hypothetical protein